MGGDVGPRGGLANESETLAVARSSSILRRGQSFGHVAAAALGSAIELEWKEEGSLRRVRPLEKGECERASKSHRRRKGFRCSH
jgi:hypothetical protein